MDQQDPSDLRAKLGVRVLQAHPVAPGLRVKWVKGVPEVFQDLPDILEKAVHRVTLVLTEDLAKTEPKAYQVKMGLTELRELLGKMEERATRAREGHQAPTESLELVDRPDQLVKKEKRARKGNQATKV